MQEPRRSEVGPGEGWRQKDGLRREAGEPSSRVLEPLSVLGPGCGLLGTGGRGRSGLLWLQRLLFFFPWPAWLSG